LFGIYIPLLPVAGAVSAKYYLPHITGMPAVDSLLAGNLPAFGDAVVHMILPTITLGLLLSGSISRVSRSEMYDALRKDHMALAKAKGLSTFDYLVRHGLRSVSLPIVTIVGLEFASILGGAVITEAVFNLPGMGTLLVNALNARDYPTMQGALALSVLWVGLMTILIDLVYILLDPRLR
jgi:ABC-type dipeptide/oligopeptide/nickel transport system permease component